MTNKQIMQVLINNEWHNIGDNIGTLAALHHSGYAVRLKPISAST